MVLKGSVLEIVKIEDNQFVIYKDRLFSVLDKVGTRKVCIISINGRSRCGKSFMVNQFLKCLDAEAAPGWIHGFPLDEFQYRESVEKQTSGILLWSEPLTLPDKEDIAILLMDCQGLFDTETEERNNILLFAFSALFSSTFIMNEITQISDLFQFLQLFLKFTTSANENGTNVAYIQHFLLLQRDWNARKEYKLGHYTDSSVPEGQIKHLNLKHHFFNIQNPAITAVVRGAREAVGTYAKNISVYAMPAPGVNPDADVDSSLWSNDFRVHVQSFVEMVISPQFVQRNCKKIGSLVVSGLDYKEFVGPWIAFLQNPANLEDFVSLLENTGKVQGHKLVENFKIEFAQSCETFMRRHPQGVEKRVFNNHFDQMFQNTMGKFEGTVFLGTDAVKGEFERKLSDELNKVRKSFWDANKLIVAKIKVEEARRWAEEERRKCDEAKLAEAAALVNAAHEKRERKLIQAHHAEQSKFLRQQHLAAEERRKCDEAKLAKAHAERKADQEEYRRELTEKVHNANLAVAEAEAERGRHEAELARGEALRKAETEKHQRELEELKVLIERIKEELNNPPPPPRKSFWVQFRDAVLYPVVDRVVSVYTLGLVPEITK